MKYRVDLNFVTTTTVEVFAESPQKAIELAEHQASIAAIVAPDFKATGVEEAKEGEDDPTAEYWEVSGRCLACDTVVFNEEYETDVEGEIFCTKCAKELREVEGS